MTSRSPTDAPADPTVPTFLERLGAWAFSQRSWTPVPLALILILVRWKSVHESWVFGLGLLIVAGGLGIRYWAVSYIGTISRTRAARFGPLMSAGPFALVRNPLYVGNFLIWIGFAICSGLLWMAAGRLGDVRAAVQRHRPIRGSGARPAFRRELRNVPRARSRGGRSTSSRFGVALSTRGAARMARGLLQRARHAHRGGSDDRAAACKIPVDRLRHLRCPSTSRCQHLRRSRLPR